MPPGLSIGPASSYKPAASAGASAIPPTSDHKAPANDFFGPHGFSSSSSGSSNPSSPPPAASGQSPGCPTPSTGPASSSAPSSSSPATLAHFGPTHPWATCGAS